MPDPTTVVQWITPALVVALFAWLRRDIAGVEARLSKRLDAVEGGLGVLRAEVRADIAAVRSDVADVRSDVADVRDRVSRIEGRIDGWQDRHHPPAA